MSRNWTHATLALILIWITSPAAAADKYQASLTEPTNSLALPFRNCASKGKVMQKGTKILIKASKTDAATTDGQHCTPDDLLCLFTLRATDGGGTDQGPVTVVLRAEVKNGAISGGHDMCLDADAAEGTGNLCPGPGAWNLLPVSLRDEDLVCYEPDAAWVAANPVLYDMGKAGHECEGVVLGAVPPPSSAVVLQASGTLCP